MSSDELLEKDQAGIGPREQRGCRNICWAQESFVGQAAVPQCPGSAPFWPGASPHGQWESLSGLTEDLETHSPARKEEWLKSRTENMLEWCSPATGEHRGGLGSQDISSAAGALGKMG